MIKNSKRYFLILIVVFIAFIVFMFIRNGWFGDLRYWINMKYLASQAVEKEFDGYICWDWEDVFYVENLSLADAPKESGEIRKINLSGEKVWVENIGKFDLYENAFDLHDKYDTRIIKAKFKGMYYPEGSYGHLGKYNHQVKITEVISYSNDFE